MKTQKILRRINIIFAHLSISLLGGGGVSSEIKCQDPIATFRFPTDNQQSVPLLPSVKVTINYKIDSSSITFDYPNLDSCIFNNSVPQTIMCIPKIVADSLIDSSYKQVTIVGDYHIVNDTVLLWQPYVELAPNTDYRIILSNLRCLRNYVPGSGYDTLDIPNTTITFRTAHYSHYLTSTNLFTKHTFLCNDTIWFKFNRKLTDTTTPEGNLIDIIKMDSVTIQYDTVITRHTSNVDFVSWLDTYDSTILRVRPNLQTIKNENYIIHLNLCRLTGDSTDNREFTFLTKTTYSIDMIAVLNDSSQTVLDSIVTYPAQGKRIFNLGDTLNIFAEQERGNFIFSHWKCSEQESINNSINNNIQFYISCENLKDFCINAVYKEKDTIIVNIIDTNRIVYCVYNGSFDYLGSAGAYYLPPGEILIIRAEDTQDEDYSYNFLSFKSNSQLLNNIVNRLIFVTNNGLNIEIRNEAEIVPKESCVYRACSEIVGNENNCEIDDIAEVTPQLGCVTTDNEQDVTFTCTIKPEYEDCYGIIGVSGPGIWEEYNEPYSSSAQATVRSKCNGKPTVSFIVERKITNLTLQLYTELDRTTELYDPDNESGIGIDKDVTIKIEFLNECGRLMPGMTQYTTEIPQPLIIPNIKCGYTIKLTPMWDLREEGFDFVEWDDGWEFTYPSPNTSHPFSFEITEDKIVKGKFIEHFRLRKIGFYLDDNRNDLTWFTTKELKNKMIEDVEVYDFNRNEENGYSSRIKYRFNDRVNISTINNKFIINDVSERIDQPSITGKNITKYTYSLNTSYQGYYGVEENDRVIRQDVKVNGWDIYIPKGEEFEIVVGIGNSLNQPYIYNQKGYKLRNPGRFKAETELPGVLWRWKQVKAVAPSGDGGIEFECIWNGIISKVNSSNQLEVIYPLPTPTNSFNEYLAINQWYPQPSGSEYTIQILNYDKMYKNYITSLAFHSLDWDTPDPNFKEILKTAGIILGIAVGVAIHGVIPADTISDPLTPAQEPSEYWVYISMVLGSALGGIIGSAIGWAIGWIIDWFITELYCNNPDPIGSGAIAYTWQNKWFGAHPAKKKILSNSKEYIQIRDKIMYFRTDVQLKKKQDYFNLGTYRGGE